MDDLIDVLKTIVSVSLKIALGLWMIAVIIGAFTFLPPLKGFAVPAMAKIMVFHVPNAMAATVASILSAWFAARYLITRRMLDDIKSCAAASTALLFWLLTTITGMLFAQIQWHKAWNWDPKESSIFILLLIYLAYFALRSAISDGPKRALATAGWTLFAAVTVPFLSYVLPNAAPSLHPTGVVFSVSGMGHHFRLIFWGATVGFIGLSIWMFRMNVALEDLRVQAYRRMISEGAGA